MNHERRESTGGGPRMVTGMASTGGHRRSADGGSRDKGHGWRSVDRFESLAKRTSEFVSGPWGSHTAFSLLAFWLGASIVVGWSQAYDLVEEVVTMVSFLFLFLLQRSQAKDTLAMQVKLNELLAAVNKASPNLINLEDRSEVEVREIHEKFQELQTGECASHSIEEIRSEQVVSDEVRMKVTRNIGLADREDGTVDERQGSIGRAAEFADRNNFQEPPER